MDNKQRYEVYLVGHGHGCYAETYSKDVIGQTWATSPAKAIANIKYRLRQKGQYLPDDLGDSEGMGYVHYELEAVVV